MKYYVPRSFFVRPGLLFALLTVVYLVFVHINSDKTTDIQEELDSKKLKGDIVKREVLSDLVEKDGIANYSKIVFLETTEKGTVPLRFLSSVESAARYNPKKTIYVVLVCHSKQEPTESMKAVQDRYSNVQYQYVTGEEAFRDTILYDWYNNHSSIFRREHLSDALRYITIWKQGNIYLDLDILSLRELRLPTNALVYETGIPIGVTNALIAFEKHHPYIKNVIDEFLTKSNSYSYTKFGKDLLTEEYRKYCDKLGPNCDIAVLPEKVLLPMGYWKNLYCFFNEHCTEYALNKTANNMVIHWYNRLVSTIYKIRADVSTGYLRLVEKHAPITYAAIQKAKEIP